MLLFRRPSGWSEFFEWSESFELASCQSAGDFRYFNWSKSVQKVSYVADGLAIVTKNFLNTI